MKSILKHKFRRLIERNGTKYLPIYQDEVFMFDINEKVEVNYIKSSKKIVIQAVNNDDERVG